MRLPEAFLERMRVQLGEEFDAFLASYDRKTIKGIRVNTLKISVEDFMAITDFDLRPVPWTRNGFYVEAEGLGKHPHYLAGLYYIQEPSAMLPAELLNPDPGEIVLDLCAAPGGKSMQLAAMMNNQGLLIANDINTKRLSALIRNAELMGVKNLLVINDHQDKIAAAMPGAIDKLVVDAPCSGEGMFKKDDDAKNAYEAYNIETCTSMQKEILDTIPSVVKTGGELVYSTCTFNTLENEGMVHYLMEKYDFSLVQSDLKMFEPGIDMPEALRVYPHLIEGEGHFAVKLRSESNPESKVRPYVKNKAPELVDDFMRTYMTEPLEGHFKVIKDRVFLMPAYAVKTSGVKVLKEGWYLGDLKKNRFEPSHAFALGLKKSQFRQCIDWSKDSLEIIKYLKCETISCDGQKGYNLICVDGYPIGWGKWAQGRLKNMYPHAWRLQ